MNKIDEIALRVATKMGFDAPPQLLRFTHALLAELSKDAEPTIGRYNALVEASDEPNPIERLRFFLSLALTGQDWLDVEKFIDDIPAPVIASEQKPVAEVFDYLEEELSAITCRHHGDPSYDHDAYWMKDRVQKLIAEARGIFTSPPNTVDIEQRVAEACAKMLEADANALASEYGYDYMGSLSFGTSTRAEARMCRYNELLELAEAFRYNKWREYL